MVNVGYSIYIPSKGRSETPLTINLFRESGVEFHVVVEPQEFEAYAKVAGDERVLTLPDRGRGLVFARNWITAYSREKGEEAHWQFDDDISRFYRLYGGIRVPCDTGKAIAACEHFFDRYENVGLLSPNYVNFVPIDFQPNIPPFFLNHRCYTAILFKNSLPYNWRPPNNEDADMTLQVLAGGLCTILVNAFMIQTATTMTLTGGQTEAFMAGKRLEMVRALERKWPGVVRVGRRFKHPQHFIKGDWKYFDTPLKRKPDWNYEGVDEMGMKLVIKSPPKHAEIKALVEREGAQS